MAEFLLAALVRAILMAIAFLFFAAYFWLIQHWFHMSDAWTAGCVVYMGLTSVGFTIVRAND